MAGLQVAVIGSAGSNRWDGAQGPNYWRKKPALLEAIAAHCRTRGGYMQVADQWGVLNNLIEPMSGASAWLERMHAVMASEIADANSGTFPSPQLTDEYLSAALGHLSTNDEYVQALAERVVKALPAVEIAMASSYVPSRASGALVPAPKAAATAAATADLHLKQRLEQQSRVILVEMDRLAGKHEQEQAAVQQALDNAYAIRVQLQDAESAVASPPELMVPDGTTAEATATLRQQQAQQITAAVTNFESALAEANAAVADAETELQDVGKDYSRAVSTYVSLCQRTDALKAPAVSPELVKAFLHPVSGKLCTPHDCVMLKLIATMDVVYGISAPLQQVSFSELRQGHGVGISLDESVREFAARIQLHANAQLRLDPNLAHVQFLAGLADRTIADEARRVMKSDRSTELTLQTAAEMVMLIEHRELEDLRLRAQNGDAQAAAELKKRASPKPKKRVDAKPDAKPDKPDPKPRVYHSDPSHPDGQCRLLGHMKGKGHSNRECRQGGSAVPVMAATAAPHYGHFYQQQHVGAQPQVSSTAMYADVTNHPAYSIWQQPSWQQPLVNAMPLGNRNNLPSAGRGGGRPPLPPPPSAHGSKCNICGYPPGHGTGFCYYDQPDKSPTWRPAAHAPPHMIALWRSRRQQLGLPPLEPRPSGPGRQPIAAFGLPQGPMLPMLPAPPHADASGETDLSSTGRMVALPAIAQFNLGDMNAYACAVDVNCSDESFAAAMPRSFLQYPPEQRLSSAADTAVDSSKQQPGALMRRLRYVDEVDKQQQSAAAQATDTTASEAMIAELQDSKQVLCLDTFLNRSAATGLSFMLPDGRWQLPGQVIVDSGATYGVGFEMAARGIGLHYRAGDSAINLVLANGTKVHILGITDPVQLVLARGTPYERRITYRFLILPGTGQYYSWLIGKNALKALGAYVDPEQCTFVYRMEPGSDSPQHSLPVKCSIPSTDANQTEALYMLQHVAVIPSTVRSAADAVGLISV